jgi:hypothetical protein
LKTIYLIIVALFISFFTNGQDCIVKLEAISGNYVGACKKGLAHGKGISSGVDKYDGTFKKGLPDGQGTYTWANGDIYIGEFKKGVKSGSGKLTSSLGTISGFWAEDEYIGKEKYPYRLFSADNTISEIQITRKGSDKNQILIHYESKGRKTQYGKIIVKALQGNYAGLIQEPWKKTLTQVTFPIRIQVENTRNDKYAERFDIIINQPGDWDVKVKLVGTKGLNVID